MKFRMLLLMLLVIFVVIGCSQTEEDVVEGPMSYVTNFENRIMELENFEISVNDFIEAISDYSGSDVEKTMKDAIVYPPYFTYTPKVKMMLGRDILGMSTKEIKELYYSEYAPSIDEAYGEFKRIGTKYSAVYTEGALTTIFTKTNFSIEKTFNSTETHEAVAYRRYHLSETEDGYMITQVDMSFDISPRYYPTELFDPDIDDEIEKSTIDASLDGLLDRYWIFNGEEIEYN